MNIVLGVTGSIAAYKAADIISKLKKLGHDIDVILTCLLYTSSLGESNP